MPVRGLARDGVRVAHPSQLLTISGTWAVICVVAALGCARRAPAITLALSGSMLGAVAGFLSGNADGPSEVPAYTAVGASVGLVSCGLIGVVTTSARSPSESLRRAAMVVLFAAPIGAVALTFLLQRACPLYVSGTEAGFCDYEEWDVLGGWVSGVVLAFTFDTLFVVGLLLMSARQARRSERTEPT
jgi:hypothetical protein